MAVPIVALSGAIGTAAGAAATGLFGLVRGIVVDKPVNTEKTQAQRDSDLVGALQRQREIDLAEMAELRALSAFWQNQVPPLTAKVTVLSDQLAQRDQRIAELEAGQLASASQIADLTARLAKLEAAQLHP